MSHFRIADYFIKKLDVNEKEFIVGNIGPDCGQPNEDWSEFTPPSEITHWTKSGLKRAIDSEAFYGEYLMNFKKLKKESYSFYIGYYIHLLTYIEFSNKIAIQKHEKYADEFEKNKDFIWVMKKDWYDIDHLYLKHHPNFHIFKVFSCIEEFQNKYLKYYSQTAMIRQIKYITDFYKNYSGNLEREYLYLTEKEMDKFVDEACINISIKLREKMYKDDITY